MPLPLYRRAIALADADEIASAIAEDSLDAALRFLDSLEATLYRLADSPGLGSRFATTNAQLMGLRHVLVDGFENHVIFYFIREEYIEVVRILHGARDLPPNLTQQ